MDQHVLAARNDLINEIEQWVEIFQYAFLRSQVEWRPIMAADRIPTIFEFWVSLEIIAGL